MDDFEGLDVPKCPRHLVNLEPVGEDWEGRDARWQCLVPGCDWVQVA